MGLLAGVSSGQVSELRELRVALYYHRQCAWCLRLKHRDGEPHGHPWPRLPFYSHGICASCKAKLQAREVYLDARLVVRDAQARVADPAAA